MNALKLEEKKIKGSLSQVYNKDAKLNASLLYYHLHADGSDYLFTQSQMDVAKDRAFKNQEDLVDLRPFWEKWIDKVFGDSLGRF